MKVILLLYVIPLIISLIYAKFATRGNNNKSEVVINGLIPVWNILSGFIELVILIYLLLCKIVEDKD